MKNKELRIIWKLAKTIWVGSTVFWIVETIIFLIIDGWHLKATHPIEIKCDSFVLQMWGFGLNLTIVICVYYIFNLNVKPKKESQ